MTTGARISWAAVVIVLAYLLAFVDPAAACTCVGRPGEIVWPTLDQASRESDAVLVGRVLTQTTLRDPPPYDGNDVAYVDLEVLKGVKGLAPGAHLRVWDAGFGSSCTHDLRPLRAGTLVAMALARNGPENREYHELMRLKVAPEDYLLRSCGDYLQVLKTDREADAVAARLRDAVRRSPKGRRTTR
jgi:hypothetical protein